jgi:hypothetical protein
VATQQERQIDGRNLDEHALPQYPFFGRGIRETRSLADAISAVLKGRPLPDLTLLLSLALLAWIAVEIAKGKDGLTVLGFILDAAIVIVITTFGAVMLLSRDQDDAQNRKDDSDKAP